MYNWYILRLEIKARQREIEKAVNRDLLFLPWEESKEKTRPFICKVLDKLGQKMINTGMYLTSKYGQARQESLVCK